jgi:polyisoprenoid-binding protein YceI
MIPLCFVATALGAGTAVKLDIDASSIRCLDTWVSEKDRQKILRVATHDILGTPQHPSIRFRSQAVEQKDDAHYMVRGRLTIRGLEKPNDFVVSRAESNRSSGEARVRLKDFGLSPPSAFGLIGTKDEMVFTFQFVLTEAQS